MSEIEEFVFFSAADLEKKWDIKDYSLDSSSALNLIQVK